MILLDVGQEIQVIAKEVDSIVCYMFSLLGEPYYPTFYLPHECRIELITVPEEIKYQYEKYIGMVAVFNRADFVPKIMFNDYSVSLTDLEFCVFKIKPYWTGGAPVFVL